MPLETALLLPGNRIRLLHDGEQCLPAMLEAITSAQREILLEMYWFDSDATGRRFAQALREKARQGVRVCISYDAVGSWGADRAMFEQLRAAGCEVYEHNPFRLFRLRLAIFNQRNHRKQLVIDGALGMTGGVNLSDLWAPVAQGGQGFRDDMISLEGPAVAQMREIFVAAWHRARAGKELPRLAAPKEAGASPVLVLANDARGRRRLIEHAYLQAIRGAQRRILIENSYFLPSLFVRHALGRAAQSGVDVRVVLPQTSDVAAMRYATHRLYAALMRRNIAVYEWGERVLHSKIAVIDDWCTVGTHNLDYRSFLHNLEINVVTVDAQIAAQLARRIQRDLDESVRIDETAWRYRPLYERLLEELFYRFRRIL